MEEFKISSIYPIFAFFLVFCWCSCWTLFIPDVIPAWCYFSNVFCSSEILWSVESLACLRVLWTADHPLLLFSISLTFPSLLFLFLSLLSSPIHSVCNLFAPVEWLQSTRGRYHLRFFPCPRLSFFWVDFRTQVDPRYLFRPLTQQRNALVTTPGNYWPARMHCFTICCLYCSFSRIREIRAAFQNDETEREMDVEWTEERCQRHSRLVSIFLLSATNLNSLTSIQFGWVSRIFQEIKVKICSMEARNSLNSKQSHLPFFPDTFTTSSLSRLLIDHSFDWSKVWSLPLLHLLSEGTHSLQSGYSIIWPVTKNGR